MLNFGGVYVWNQGSIITDILEPEDEGKPSSNNFLGTNQTSLPAGTFESMFFLYPFGGICDRSLEGRHIFERLFDQTKM